MASKLNVESFVKVVERSRLVATAELEKITQSSADGELTADSLAEKLIGDGQITRWQAAKLLQGRHKGFFLGKYRLQELLGKGGMSSVYLAEHSVMRRNCAIKVLPFKHLDQKGYIDRFYREAQAIAALDHANIVRAYDVDHYEDPEGGPVVHYLVMEYVDGLDLQELVESDGRLDPGVAAAVMLQAAEGLQHAHDGGFIHRDIKPGNLLVDQRGVVKILDLGLARLFGENENETGSVTKDNNQKVLGTADYLSPEQALDSHEVDPRTDIYSLGCTFYFLLLGHPPFEGGTLAQRLMAHQTKDVPPIRKERPEVPESLTNIVDRMMSKSPGDRYQTAEELVKAIGDWMREAGLDVDAGPTFENATRKSGDSVSQSAVTIVKYGGAPAPPPAGSQNSALAGTAGVPTGASSTPTQATGNDSPDGFFIDSSNEPVSSAVLKSGSRRKVKKKSRSKTPMIAAACGLVTVVVVAVCIALFGGGGGDGDDGGGDGDGQFGETAGLKPEMTVGEDGDFQSIVEALEFTRKNFADASWDTQVIKVKAGTYRENIKLESDVADPFPQNVELVADGRVFLEPADGQQPILTIDGIKGFTFRGFRLKSATNQPAIALSGYLVGTRIEQLLISDIASQGIKITSGLSFRGDDKELLLSRIQFEGAVSSAVGIQFEPQANLQSFITIDSCTFIGPFQSGIDFNDYVGGNAVRGCVFANSTIGIRFSGESPVVSSVELLNNTFYNTNRGIQFDQHPSEFSERLSLTRNAFVDCSEGDLFVDRDLSRSEFMKLIQRQRHNWTTREEVADQEVDISKRDGRRGFTEWDFTTRDSKDRQFLVPGPGSALLNVGTPEGFESPQIGGRKPAS